MKFKYYCCIILTFLITTLTAEASTVLHARTLNANNGLPSNTVRCMFEDSQGFLWFGTINGLSRYDGNSFLNLQTGNNTATDLRKGSIQLADNRIYQLWEDKHDCLWIKTMAEHFSCFDLQRARFVDYTGNGQLRQNYSDLFVASNGDVWLWQNGNGAIRCTMDKERNFNTMTYKTAYGNLPDNHVTFITEDKEGHIWIGTTKGLTKISNGKSQIINRQHAFKAAFNYKDITWFITTDGIIYKLKNTGSLITAGVIPGHGAQVTGIVTVPTRCIVLTSKGGYAFTPSNKQVTPDKDFANVKNGNTYIDNKGKCWVFNHSGIFYRVQDDGEVKVLSLIPKGKMQFIDFERYDVEEASNGTIWISTYGNGLFAYHPQTDDLEHFTASLNEQELISSDFLLGVLEDRSGGIWISTEYSGLSRLTIDNSGTTQVFPTSPSLLDRSNTIRVLAKMRNGDILVGTRKGGLFTYDASFNRKSNNRDLTTSIYAIATDKQRRTWWGTRGDGLNIGGKWYNHSDKDPSSLSYDHIFSLHCDRKGRMWVGTFGGGLDLAVPRQDGSYKFRHFLTAQYGNRMVRYITEDSKGNLWVATGEGLIIFNPDKMAADPKAYHVFSYTNGMFCSNEIRCIFRDSKGRMWVGTVGGGLTLCELSADNKALKYTQYTTQQGLVNDVIQSIQEDKYGHLWVATEYGISRFTPDGAAFENHFFASETLGNAYSENCACTLDDGRLLFGTNYGIMVIDPDRFKDTLAASPVTLTALYVNGTRARSDAEDSPLDKALSYSKEIHLKSYQNSIRIMFSTLNYSDKSPKYKFYLENYDKDWNAPTSLNFADYKYLSPGTYILHVKASNGAGVWNEQETTLRIVVAPPFYASVWAFLIYIIIAGAAAWMGFRIFRNFIRLRNRINVEKGLTEYKLVFFTNISHEFRTPLTLMEGSLERLQRIPDLPLSVRHPLHGLEKSMNRMLRLVNQLMEFRKMQHGKLALSLEETDVIAFLCNIFQDFKEAATQKQMQYNFISTVPSYTMFIDKEKLDKIVYNILSNAFKYTPSKGKIQLTIHIDEDDKQQLRIEVADTGVGIPKDKQKELFKRFMQSSFSGNSIGIGLHLTHELVLIHKGSITYRENEGGGSVFTVCIPTDKSIYKPGDFLVEGNVLLKEQHEEEKEQYKQVMPYTEDNTSTTPMNKQKLLIIEDNEDIRQFLKEEIGHYFIVETAVDGTEGLEKAKEYDPDLIVSDVLMPGIDGFEVTRRLKTDIKTSHIPIILLTALSSENKHLEGIEAGADAYIPKPFSIKLLMARIFHLLEQREKLRKKFSTEPATPQITLCASDRDKEFVDRLAVILNNNMADPNFTVDKFAQLMKFGRTVFYKKIRGVTGYSPNEYLRIMRMKKAAELLLSPENYTVAEVAYKVGINDPFYFSKCFKAQFGISPSVYQKGEAKGND